MWDIIIVIWIVSAAIGIWVALRDHKRNEKTWNDLGMLSTKKENLFQVFFTIAIATVLGPFNLVVYWLDHKEDI
tara:strand:+ start:123 stop:344 length:222 start_codon:yes stop_codon:yes gene_type:complete